MKTYPTIKGLSIINKLCGLLISAYGLAVGLYAISVGQAGTGIPVIFIGLVTGLLVYAFGEMLGMVRDMAENIGVSTEINIREFKERQVQKPNSIKRLKEKNDALRDRSAG